MSSEPALLVEGLFKSYGALEAVRGVGFAVRPGEVLAIVGPNGAGKSTILKIVATILEPDAGRVEVFGRDISRQARDARAILGYLPEEAGAYRSLTGGQYLRFMASLYESRPERIESCVAEASRLSGLGARLEDKIKTYSKGMTRKLLLSRTVMTRPRLALLDEPTSGLDVLNALEIRRTIRSLAAEGMSFLVSSHNMLEVEFLSDRVAILSGGRILACDAPRALKESHGADNLEDVFVELAR